MKEICLALGVIATVEENKAIKVPLAVKLE